MALTLKAKNLMDTNVFFIDDGRTVAEAIKLMLEKGVWSLVVTRNDLPSGVITEHDAIRKVIALNRDLNLIRVREAASSEIWSVQPDAPVVEVMKTMMSRNLRRLFVVENGKIVGRITRWDSMKNLLDAIMSLTSLRHAV